MTNGNLGGPFSGGSVPSAGAGSAHPGVADFHAALDVFKTVMGQLVPSGLLHGFGVMALGGLVTAVPVVLSRYLTMSALLDVGGSLYGDATQSDLLGTLLGLLGAGLMLLLFAARLGLARPMRMIILDGPGSTKSVGDVLRLAFERFGPNLAISSVYIIAVAVSSLCCVLPGIVVAVILYPATYLVATERRFADSFSMSVAWMKRHTGALLGTSGVVAAGVVVLSCCNCGFSGLLSTRFGPMTVVYLMPVGWLMGEVFGFFAVILLGSACIAADRADAAGQQQARSVGPF